MNWPQRIQQLLSQLEQRARSCPGLYPVQSSADFQRLVDDHLARENNNAGDREMAEWLEELWRSPELSYQLNAQSLIRRGQSPFLSAEKKSATN